MINTNQDSPPLVIRDGDPPMRGFIWNYLYRLEENPGFTPASTRIRHSNFLFVT